MNANRLTAIVGAVVIVAVIALGWFLGISPLLGQASAAGEELAGIQTQNDALRADLIVKKKQFDDIASYQKQLESLGVVLPIEHVLDKFYDAAEKCFAQTGVVPGAVTTGDALPYVSTGIEGIVEPDPAYASKFFTIPVTVSTDTSDAAKSWAMVKCIQEEQPRLFVVNSIEYIADNNGSVKISGFLVQLKDPATVAAGVVAPPAAAPDPSATPSPSETPAPSGTPTPDPSETASALG